LTAPRSSSRSSASHFGPSCDWCGASLWGTAVVGGGRVGVHVASGQVVTCRARARRHAAPGCGARGCGGPTRMAMRDVQWPPASAEVASEAARSGAHLAPGSSAAGHRPRSHSYPTSCAGGRAGGEGLASTLQRARTLTVAPREPSNSRRSSTTGIDRRSSTTRSRRASSAGDGRTAPPGTMPLRLPGASSLWFCTIPQPAAWIASPSSTSTHTAGSRNAGSPGKPEGLACCRRIPGP
jgi:hypothetical protein